MGWQFREAAFMLGVRGAQCARTADSAVETRFEGMIDMRRLRSLVGGDGRIVAFLVACGA